jgi:hypothetical protein
LEIDAGGTGEIEFPDFCDIMSAKEKEKAIAATLGMLETGNAVANHEKKFHLSPVRKAEAGEAFRLQAVDRGELDQVFVVA